LRREVWRRENVRKANERRVKKSYLEEVKSPCPRPHVEKSDFTSEYPM
jgi:hypothetical protein